MAGRLTVVAVTALLLAAAAHAGEITGTLTPAGKVSSVTAVNREKEKPGGIERPYTASYDGETGEYRFRNLPGGTYDIIVESAVGRIEGVNLNVKKDAPGGRALRLKPSELDKGEIAAIAVYLAGLCKDRENRTTKADGILAHVRQAGMKAVYLVSGKPGGDDFATFKVPLKDEEIPQVSDMLLGLISLVRVRDQLPRDFDLAIDAPKTGAGHIRVVPTAPEMTGKDRKWLIDWVNNLKIFQNKKRVLDLDGTGDRAHVLVEKLRDKPTTLPGKEPTAFWRIEIFDFRKYYGGWSKEKYTVIVRQRVAMRKFRTYRWMFEKRLGGIRVSADAVTTVPGYVIPAKLDPARGRVPF